MSAAPIRVAIDVTPMLGPPTGVHQATAGLVEALRGLDGVELSGYVLSFRGRRGRSAGPEWLPTVSRRWPAGLAHRTWARTAVPGATLVAGSHDVVHGTNYTVPPSAAAIVTVQDLTIITHPEWCTRPVRRMAGALRHAIRRGAHVHVTSEQGATEARRLLGVSPDRMHVVPVALNPVGPGDGDRGRSLVGADRYVLALGTTEPRKNLTLLPAAVAALAPDVVLAVVGPVGPAERDLDSAVTTARMGDRYRRIGVVSDPQRSDLLRGAAALAYPSLAEGFGLPPLEALTVGCPVAASSVGALPDLIGDQIELVEPGNGPAFIETLRTVVDEPPAVPASILDRLADLTWDAAANSMVETYRRVAGRSG